MNQNQVKAIQSRLKSRGAKFTLEQIRTFIFTDYHDEELTEEQMSAIVEKLSGSDARGLANTALSEIIPIDAGELSHTQKQTIIQQVASTLEVNLSVDQVKQISQKMDWALSDRASLKSRIQSAIIAWVDYQLDQDDQQTDNMMQEVEGHLTRRLQQSNQHFKDKAGEFSDRVSEAVEKFRTTETEILDLFKIPS